MAKLKRVMPWESDEGKCLFLSLERRNDLTVVCVVDANGEGVAHGDLLVLSSNGLRRTLNVNPDFGFSLDKEGRIEMNGG